MKTFEEIEVVSLNCDLPEHGLSAGSIGTVVHVFRDNAVYEVEFVDEAGETTALLPLEAEQLDAYRPASEAPE